MTQCEECQQKDGWHIMSCSKVSWLGRVKMEKALLTPLQLKVLTYLHTLETQKQADEAAKAAREAFAKAYNELYSSINVDQVVVVDGRGFYKTINGVIKELKVIE